MFAGRMVVVVIALLAGTIPSRWAVAEKVGILEVMAPGIPEAAAKEFETSLVEGLEGADFQVEKRAAFVAVIKEKSAWVEGCTFGPCMSPVFKATGIRHALVMRVQGVGSSYSFVASLIDTKSGQLLGQAQRDCAACSINDAVMEAALLGSELRQSLSTPGSSANDGETRDPASASASDSAESRRGSLRTTSYVFLALGALAGGAGGYFLGQDDDKDKLGMALLGGGGAAFVGGVTMFAFSRQF